MVFLQSYQKNIVLISDSLKLKSEMNLDTSLSIGDKCNVQPIHEKNFLVLPENIKCKF